MNLTDAQIDTVQNAAYDADTRVFSYSGRAMFGQQCLAIAVDATRNLTAFFVSLAVNDQELAMKLSREIRMDQLGRGEVAYFPSIGFSSEDEDDEI